MSGGVIPRFHRASNTLGGVLIVIATVCTGWCALRGEAQLEIPAENDGILIQADVSHEWTDGRDQILVLRRRCRITQGTTRFSARKIVVWRRTERTGRGEMEHVDLYLEDDVVVSGPDRTLNESSLLLSLTTRRGVAFEILQRSELESGQHDAVFRRGQSRRRSTRWNGLLPTQLLVPGDNPADPQQQGVPFPAPAGNLRRIQVFPRSAVPYNVLSFESQETTPPEQVWVLDGGINLFVEGVDVQEFGDVGTINLAADRMVIWTQSLGGSEFQTELTQDQDTPFQVYLEGNIVVRQGQHVIRATTAFYDARENRAIIDNAELKVFVPQLGGNLRVRAQRLRQLTRESFHAQNAWVTTSQFGKPGYRIAASDIFFEQRYATPWLGGGANAVDPLTGIAGPQVTSWVTSLNNTLYVEDVPVFYAPYLSGPAEDPGIPIRSVSVGSDSIFGVQMRTRWDMFKLLGRDRPDGVDWDARLDYLSERGPAIGTGGSYQGTDLFGLPGIYSGSGLVYYVHDEGEDNLGMDRLALPPETDDRWRALLRHRQALPNNMLLLGEIGILSDRNFLEQYYENEFDRHKDNETLLYLKQDWDNWSWSLLGRPQANEFETTTEWLPKGDLYVLSEPLLNGAMTWSSHSSVGYAQLRPGDPPPDPILDPFTPLPYVTAADGAVAMTRHEVDAPFHLGPLNVVPFAMGEAAAWSEGFGGDDVERIVGRAGVRSSLTMWRLFPYVQSRIFNLNGLAHKITFDGEYAYTDSSESLSLIPQYNEFDDNAQERFRQRLLLNTYGGMLPPFVEPRSYAIRTGAGATVTAPYHELIDDQQVLRFNVRHRLQTKVGPPQRIRIKDWMTLDTGFSYFPQPADDNFGEHFGLMNGNYRWNVGERTSILADALYDVFDGGQELWSLGVLSQRSMRGSVYVGLRQVKAADFDSQILTASYSYVMSPKWVSTFGTAYDLAEDRNRGQSLTITRVGADFLVHLGMSFDESKDNAGIAVSIEPRLGPFNGTSTQLSSLLGVQ